MKYLKSILESIEFYPFEDGGLEGATYYYYFSDGQNDLELK